MNYETALLVFGILLLLIGLVGQVKAKELEVGTSNAVARTVIGIVGAVLIGLSVAASNQILPLLKGAVRNCPERYHAMMKRFEVPKFAETER